MLSAAIVMPGIIFRLLLMKVNKGLKQIRQNTCNSLWFNADGIIRGDTLRFKEDDIGRGYNFEYLRPVQCI